MVIRVLGLGYKDIYQAYIEVYCNNQLIDEKETNNGQIKVCLKNGNVYELKITINNILYKRNVYVTDDIDIYDIILFSNYINNIITRNITFLLTDLNYENLPIERGNLILW